MEITSLGLNIKYDRVTIRLNELISEFVNKVRELVLEKLIRYMT